MESRRIAGTSIFEKITSMCDRQTLFYEPAIGSVVYCRQCDHIQLAFGNIAFTFILCTLTDLNTGSGKSGKMKWCRRWDRSNARYTSPTPCQGINILLNPFELARLNDMLDLADTEWKAFQLPDLFEVHDGEKI
jgi:hypothetical protein